MSADEHKKNMKEKEKKTIMFLASIENAVGRKSEKHPHLCKAY